MNKEDKYYYFPTMTTKKALIRGEKYIYSGKWYGMVKGGTYTLTDFTNNDSTKPLIFKNKNEIFKVSCWDIGYFKLLKTIRKEKLLKLKN